MKKLLCKTCSVCGKKFNVEVDKNGKILTKCFYSKIHKYHFLGWAYPLEKIEGEYKVLHNTKDMYFKNKFYRIIGFSKISREIIYFVWKLLYGWQKIEYWECPKCFKEW